MSDSTIIGWTSVDETNAALARLFGAEAWSQTDQKPALLNTAYSEIRDNPNYDFSFAPERVDPATQIETDKWAATSAENKRRLTEAQQLHALDILLGGGSANENSKLRSQGIKSFSISKFSLTFDEQRANLNKSEVYLAGELSQRVKDKLFPFLLSVPVRGTIQRIYP